MGCVSSKKVRKSRSSGSSRTSGRRRSKEKKHSHQRDHATINNIGNQLGNSSTIYVNTVNNSMIKKETSTELVYVGLFDYKARSQTDMNFRKGDLMELIDNNEGEDWRMARHIQKKIIGLVPSVFIAVNGSLESKDWYFGNMTRREAETLLLSSTNKIGTFMVRHSEKGHNLFSISIKGKSTSKGPHTKHYRTRYNRDNKVCLFPAEVFDSIIDLIEYYSSGQGHLGGKLIKPCKRPIPQLWDLAPELVEQWEIPRSELQLTKKLGSGQFGDVFYGTWKNSIEVAIKTCKPESMSTEEFLAEAAILKKYRHPRLVALYAVCTKEQPIYLVTEFMVHGNLLEYLNKYGSKIEFNHLLYIALQIAEGMCYLESKSLVHSDLAARNILIGHNNLAKIADFGLARVMNSDYQSRTNTEAKYLPIKWTALEVIQRNEYSTKSDVWSFGITLMELFTYGGKPYGNWTLEFTIFQLERGVRMQKPEKMPNELYDTIYKCWDVDPSKRPTFEYFKEFFEAYTIGTEGQYQDEL